MRNLVIGLGLLASTGAASATTAPPFVLRCEAQNGTELPVSVKWDGNDLAIHRTNDATGPTMLLKKPVSNFFDTRTGEQRNAKGASTLQLSFRGEEAIVWDSPRLHEKESVFVSLFLTLNQSRDVEHAWLSQAAIAGDVLMGASQTPLLNCVTTLGL